MADEEHRAFERDVLSGRRTQKELKQFRLARGRCPFCGSVEIEEWDIVEVGFTEGGLPVAGLGKIQTPGWICQGCCGPSMLAVHWATYEVEGIKQFVSLDVVSLMKPGRHGVEPKLGKVD